MQRLSADDKVAFGKERLKQDDLHASWLQYFIEVLCHFISGRLGLGSEDDFASPQKVYL